MEVIEVKGRDISPKTLQEPRWLTAHERKRKRGKPPSRKPAEDLKVILHPRGGFDAAQLGTVAVSDGMLRAAEISYDEACSDTLRMNVRQKALTVSTTSRENAFRYSEITSIRISTKDYRRRLT